MKNVFLKNNFSGLDMPRHSVYLFDKIIDTIKKEEEKQKRRRFAFGFFFVFICVFVFLPFSSSLLYFQTANSGFLHFFSIAINDFGIFVSLLPNSILAIAESVPVFALLLFSINLTIFVVLINLFTQNKERFFKEISNPLLNR